MTTLLVSEIFPPKIGGSGRWFWELYSRLPGGAYAVAAGDDPRAEEVAEVDCASELAIGCETCSAKSDASSRPMPLEAPVMSVVWRRLELIQPG